MGELGEIIEISRERRWEWEREIDRQIKKREIEYKSNVEEQKKRKRGKISQRERKNLKIERMRRKEPR